MPDREFVWHFTAAWVDVQNKARRIRNSGHVRIISASPAFLVGEVRGDTNIYQSSISFVPGTRQVATWDCGCAWAAYSWGRSGRWKKYEGRQCSHSLALMWEGQSRGMFGQEVAEDAQKPSWQNDPSITVQRPGDYKKPDIGEWRLSAKTAAKVEERTLVKWKNRLYRATGNYDSAADSYEIAPTTQPNRKRWVKASELDVIVGRDESRRYITEKVGVDLSPAEDMARTMLAEGAKPSAVLSALHRLGAQNAPSILNRVQGAPTPVEESTSNTDTGVTVTLATAEWLGLDPKGSKWYLVCEDHGELLSGTNRATLKSYMRSPSQWCETCRETKTSMRRKAQADTDGVMIALRPPDHILEAVQIEGGEPFDQLHVTVAYLGDTEGLDRADLFDAVAIWADITGSMPGQLSGYGIFENGEEPVLYASVDVVGLDRARSELFEALALYGIEPQEKHGMQPHLTLMYDTDEAPDEMPEEAMEEFTFTEVILAYGGEWTTLPLLGEPEFRAASLAELKDFPEPALPETTGDEEVTEVAEFEPEVEVEDFTGDIKPGDQRLAWLMQGNPRQKGGDDMDISAAARAYLGQKTALKDFSPAEQRELIEEGEVEGVVASNLDRLDIAGTHYEALEAARQVEEEELWLL